jgi:glycosyltransferase involved in cell wall biosynthesis/coenzyme F420-reducing hydrogenase beta subunit
MIYPKITIITPCYNGEFYIKRWANSILRQDYPSVEVVFINDGSTDNTKKIIDSVIPIAKKENIEIIYIFQKNGGAASAVANGLQYSTGEFLLLFDVDDELTDNALHIFAQYLLDNPKCDIVFANKFVHQNNQKSLANINLNHDADAYESILKGSLHCSAGTYMLRLDNLKSYYNETSFFYNGGGQNLQVILPILYKNRKLNLLNFASMINYINTDSHSNFDGDNEKAELRIKQWKEIYTSMVINLATSKHELDHHLSIVDARFNEKQGKKQYRFLQFPKKFLQIHPATIDPNESCSGCHACAAVCPQKCITMKLDAEGFLYPHINNVQCDNCEICRSVCPFKRNASINKTLPAAYAAYNKDEKVRYNSSSGGVFGFLAYQTISQGGVVFGAAFNEKNELVHNCTENLEDLPKFFGSKYIQSIIGDTYNRVKIFLDGGRQVLFCGTPCQTEGLNAFLGKKYDNLLLLDFVCHGVPSPKVWAGCSEQYNELPIKSISFRDKSMGWEKSGQVVVVVVDDPQKGIVTHRVKLYGRGFLSNYYLRPSCYNCKTKKLNRVSDITLADFWGINEIDPELNDDKGLSLLLVHSEKGERALQNNKIWRKQVNLMQALNHNYCAHTSVLRPIQRDRFFEDFNKYKYKKIMKKYCSEKPVKSLFIRCLRRAYRIVKRFV